MIREIVRRSCLYLCLLFFPAFICSCSSPELSHHDTFNHSGIIDCDLALPVEPDVETTCILVAYKDLVPGDILSIDNVVLKPINVHELPRYYLLFDDLERIKGSKMAFPAKEGEVLTWYHTEIPDYIKQK